MAAKYLTVRTQVERETQPVPDGEPVTIGHRLVLWERDALHPGGEIYCVSDGQEYRVGVTDRVNEKISTGEFVIVSNNGGAA